MKSVRIDVAVVVLLVISTTVSSSALASEGRLPESALVVVMTRHLGGAYAGNGFIVGDGTLVVTCEHNIYEHSEKGAHRCEGFVAVFSPYLGRACDARILASDEDLDLAVLEVPWKGHPSLLLAHADAILDATSARIVGLPRVIGRLDNWDSVDSPEDFEAQEEVLPVAYVGLHERIPLLIVMCNAREVRLGWSGSAIVLPGTSVALGCFSMSRHRSRGGYDPYREVAGSVVCQLPGLLGDDFDKNRLHRAETFLERPADAREACALALHTSSHLRPDKYESALEPARAFIRLRPDCGFGHKVLAYAAERAGRMDVARESYERAMELDPNSIPTQLVYAQFLTDNGDPSKAEQILEPLWRAARSRGLVAIGMVNLLNTQKESARCIEILEEATQAEPRNAHLWQLMAAWRGQNQGPAVAIEPLTRAVELRPEEGPPRGTLARVLEMTGNLDEAEKHFRTLLDVEPGNPVVYCWLARFLSRHRPEACQEAMKMAEKALELPPHPSLPREKIEQLSAEIRGRIETNSQN